ncbi:hypothetical protein HELRODRAFT_95556 [Helobdella robusta]|uniref:Post-GPI attachment to proteins factor 3 n=1 Tax=Helobdella robusta TaxID=6412 RepID=T1G968_HELRO|nr:hypothetical protein HELRODRAFT_95556 [Helobdella robusta]ESN96701.1 hypothetical protein HELRODRAFT_95556 [Helobdella robusta]
MKKVISLISTLAWLATTLLYSSASNGDLSQVFLSCRDECYSRNCSTPEKQKKFYNKHPLILKLTMWDCLDECEHQCIWPTVDVFREEHDIVPKFYGKWPFIRILGSQEIASSIASLLNLCSHIYMIRIFRKQVRSSSAMYYLWNVTTLVGINTWFWSFLFHMRDTPFTEKMDYFCAVSAVMYNLYIFIHRTTLGNRALHLSVGSTMLLFFTYHVYYLSFVRFDYGYNMRVNVAIGLANALGWITWSLKVRRQQPYATRCAISIVITLLFMLLEIWDFPPILGIFDAHSLWHFGTAPIALLWYRFGIEDCLYLKKMQFYKT